MNWIRKFFSLFYQKPTSYTVLADLQREGRLIDFLQEDLSQLTDEEIGSAVRKIQIDCKNALSKYVPLISILPKKEGEMIEVNSGFCPNKIKLTGKVKGDAPYRGIVVHSGWQAEGEIIQAAEVEIG